MHMFCSCYLIADKSLRHTTVQHNVWLWPPLPDFVSEPKGSMQTSPVSKFYGSVAGLHLPLVSAAVEFKLCTLQAIGQARGARQHDSYFPWADMFVTTRGDGVKKNSVTEERSWWIRESWTNKGKIWDERATTKLVWQIKKHQTSWQDTTWRDKWLNLHGFNLFTQMICVKLLWN